MKLFIYCVPILLAMGSYAQTTYPKPLTLTADEDHHQMMDQLGVKSLRPGPNHSFSVSRLSSTLHNN